MTATTEPRAAGHWLAAQARGVRGTLTLSVVAGVINALATIAQLFLMAWLVHEVVVGGGSFSLLWLGGVLLLAVAIRALAQAVQEIAGARASDQVRAGVRQSLLAAWAGAGPVGLAGTDAGRLASEWVEQVDALHGYFARFRPQVILAVAVPVIILVLVFYLDWLAGLFLLAAAPLIPLFMALVGMGAERVNRRHYESLARLSGHFLDRIRGLTTLQLFGATTAAVSDVAEAAEDYRRLNMATLRIAFLSSAVLEFFASVAIAAVAIYVGFALLGSIEFGPAADMTLFSGLLVLLLAPEFFQPLRLVSQYYHDRAAALGAASHLMARLDTGAERSAVRANVEDQPDGDMGQGIHAAGLNVSHPRRPPVLTDVSFDLNPGETLVVSGASGSGKTTLLAVLAGFIRPDSGEVRVLGHPPGSFPLGWMGQRPWLITGSWRENLQLTAPRASDAEMEEALQRVGMGKVLAAQEAGLDATLGEGGVGLSGGQARRLALARLFLTPSPVMLLDEPTAGLDAATEAEVLEGLKGIIGGGRICVLATHRPAAMALADRHLLLGDCRND
ncbi:ATP-binding cassette subfamily C protein CydD [Halospina denitrificans]|uniref:ATP-binding cassette subfamily C protein CydD n=1 Tax=Halospina denitrificans TaxID=332522 RepID=A0A4R7K0A3_9GAMM|nr:ATP-binding cassette subfamily C protein CydD [Halospina denitrificans]